MSRVYLIDTPWIIERQKFSTQSCIVVSVSITESNRAFPIHGRATEGDRSCELLTYMLQSIELGEFRLNNRVKLIFTVTNFDKLTVLTIHDITNDMSVMVYLLKTFTIGNCD